MIILIIFFCLILLGSYLYLLKGTVFGVSSDKGEYSGFFIFYQLLMFIIPSSIILNIFDISDFWVAFKVKQESVFWISILIIFSMLLYFICLSMFSRMLPKFFKIYNVNLNKNSPRILIFNRLCLLVCIILITLIWLGLGIGHSFSLAIIDNVSISGLRHSITDRKEGRVLKHLFLFIIPLITAIVASPVYKEAKKERVISILLVFFIASWGGSKGPLLVVFIIYIVSYATFIKLKLTAISTLKFLLFIIALLGAVYFVVSLQYSNLKNFALFLDFFYQRIFIAQIIGVYEQFNLWLHDLNYIWHGVPFASFVVDYPQFHKDLMMISEDRGDANNIGIKNTLFIAEAYGMGGWLLLCLSPIIMAFNFCVSYLWIVLLLNKFAFNNLEFTKRIVAISLFSYIGVTGGFSDLMLFKITIMVTILISPFLICALLLNKFRSTF